MGARITLPHFEEKTYGSHDLGVEILVNRVAVHHDGTRTPVQDQVWICLGDWDRCILSIEDAKKLQRFLYSNLGK